MSNKDNDIFTSFLKDVQPLKKTNKVTKSIPKQKFQIEKTKKLSIANKTNPDNKSPKQTTHKHSLEIEKNYKSRKLKKGRIKIDKKIDFHGLSLQNAKTLFLETINECFVQNHRCILFITGKGLYNQNKERHKNKKLYYGKIRNNILEWTQLHIVKSKILNVQRASPEHGGDGAFFIYLRKNKIRP